MFVYLCLCAGVFFVVSAMFFFVVLVYLRFDAYEYLYFA